MDFSLYNIKTDDLPTKQKIIACALKMFCTKGYAETTIRDIATAVGITPGTIYSHYPSKDDILLYMLNDYGEYTKDLFKTLDIVPILKEKPTGEGIAICVLKSISILTDNVYYGNLVHLIHQEQHRNVLFGNFVLLRLQNTQEFIEKIFNVLKEMNVIKADAGSENWGFITYGVLHLVPTCIAISSITQTPSYAIKDIMPMLSEMFDAVIEANKP